MAAPLRTVVHANGTVQRIFATWVETEIPGLETLYACPMVEQRETADCLGYGDDVDALTRDHDFLHAWLADVLGLPASYALTAAAGGTVDPAIAEAEEAAVMALQRFTRLAGVDTATLA
jgi:hypothetical protein